MREALMIGDYVVHNTFPPIEGYVSIIQPMLSGVNRIGVFQENETIFYDDEDTWNLVKQSHVVYDSDIIDVDYIEIKEEDNQ